MLAATPLRGDDERAFAVDEVPSRAVDIDRGRDDRTAATRVISADLIEEEASGDSRRSGQSERKGDIEHRHADERASREVHQFRVPLPRSISTTHRNRAGVELKVSFAHREGDIWNGDRDGRDRECSGDAIGRDLKVAGRVIDDHDVRAIGGQGDMPTCEAVTRTLPSARLLEAEVSAEGSGRRC